MGGVLSSLGEHKGKVLALGAVAALLLLRRRRAQHRVKGVKYGPRATDLVVVPGDGDYDKRMREMWGGPPPKHFQKCYDEWPASHSVEGKKKVALVTGGSGGIGFYVVKILARLGYEVILPARPGFEAEAKGAVAAVTAAVPGATVTVPAAALDLASFASVRAFAADVRARYQSLDLLCLNAGRGGSKGDPREATGDDVEAIVQVNAVSHFLLCAELLALLRAAPAARVVSQTSGARCMFQPAQPCPTAKLADLGGTDAAAFSAWHQYCLSKAANCFFTQGLNDRLKEAGVSSIVAVVSDPGFASTGVNIQHNLGHSLVGLPDGWLSTELMHSIAGQHAADGALTMALGCVMADVRPNDWFTPAGATGVSGPPKRGDPAAHRDAKTDPMNPGSVWPASSREVFWKQAQQWTGAQWDFGRTASSL